MSGLGLNGALWMGYSGLSTAQLQINTAGRNLANSDTPGASRQSVAITEDVTIQIGQQNLSVGVYALGTSGTRSQYLDGLVQTENSNLGAATTTSNLMTLVQNALQEQLSTTQTDGTETPSQTGLEAATTSLFDAWSALSANPTSSSLRDAVSAAALSFSTTAKSIYSDMLSTKQSAYTEANSQVATANSLITQITSLNQQIASAEDGDKTADGMALNQAGDMRDQRESLIEQLSTIVNVNVTTDPSNSSMVDIQLADGSSNGYQLSTAAPAPAATAGSLVFGGTTVNVTAGESMDDIAASINSSVTNVSATVSNGSLVLTSSGSIDLTGSTSNVAASLTASPEQTPSDSNAIMLVNGANGGGVTKTGGADPDTYLLAVSGSDGSNDSGYAPDKSLAILAESGTGAAVSVAPTGGNLGGLVTFDNDTLGYEDQASLGSGSTLMDRFNTYINNVVTTVNGLVSGGYDLDGNAATSNPPFVTTSTTVPTLPATGTLTIDGTSISITATDDLSSIAAKINAADPSVDAVVADGKLSLQSAKAITISGSSSLATALTSTSTHGGDFFYDSSSAAASTGAWNLGVNPIYDYTNNDYDSSYMPAASQPVTTGTSSDGSLATSIGDALNNTNIASFYNTFVTDVGAQTSAANTNLSAQQLVSNQAVTSQQSYSGISTDEEMTDLLSFQRAYEANSRFINTINEMYQLLTQSLGNT